MEFEQDLLTQQQKHPALTPQDVFKLCYQAAYGAEHLLTDPEGARRCLIQEYAQTEASDAELYEPISETVCRVNLAGWKREGLPLEWLFRLFLLSAGNTAGDKALLTARLDRAEQLAAKGCFGFSPEAWAAARADYEAAGMSALHHSEVYRAAEHPAYRIVERRLLRLLPVLRTVAERDDPAKIFVIAVDGRAASGKSTMAQQLSKILDASVVHMDDFFLPLEMRTEERLSTPGGNVHYERFREEVLPHLRENASFAYRKFECSIKDFRGERQVEAAHFRIVEGSYSLHPELGRYADLNVFSEVDPEEQMRRILARNGPEWGEMFRTRWIPLEESYFSACGVRQRADLLV